MVPPRPPGPLLSVTCVPAAMAMSTLNPSLIIAPRCHLGHRSSVQAPTANLLQPLATGRVHIASGWRMRIIAQLLCFSRSRGAVGMVEWPPQQLWAKCRIGNKRMMACLATYARVRSMCAMVCSNWLQSVHCAANSCRRRAGAGAGAAAGGPAPPALPQPSASGVSSSAGMGSFIHAMSCRMETKYTSGLART